MRGRQPQQTSMLCLLNIEDRVARNHPLRAIKSICDEVLKEISPQLSRMYSSHGRPSIPPERMLTAG